MTRVKVNAYDKKMYFPSLTPCYVIFRYIYTLFLVLFLSNSRDPPYIHTPWTFLYSGMKTYFGKTMLLRRAAMSSQYIQSYIHTYRPLQALTTVSFSRKSLIFVAELCEGVLSSSSTSSTTCSAGAVLIHAVGREHREQVGDGRDVRGHSTFFQNVISSRANWKTCSERQCDQKQE